MAILLIDCHTNLSDMISLNKSNFVLMLTVISSLFGIIVADEPDLEIHYTFKPEQCKRKAKVTDILTLHYKGTLEDGTVFDSRLVDSMPPSL